MTADANVNHEAEHNKILDSLQDYRRMRVYTAFAELQIGNALVEGPESLDTLATRIDADPATLRRFLEAAAAQKLVTLGDNEVRLTDLGWRLYAPSSADSVENTLRLEAAFFERWSRLTEAVRSGRRPAANRQQEQAPDWVPVFTRALYERSRETTEAVANSLTPVIDAIDRDPVRVLDLGGGHGGYSIALARRHPDVSATVFDLPPVIETSATIIAENGMGDRITPVSGDFHVDDIGRDWDVILLFGVLHGETEGGAKTLLTAIRNALSPQGVLLIRSRGRSDDAAADGERELFDLHMLLSTEGGRVQRSTDVDQLLAEYGFSQARAIPIKPPMSGNILVYRVSR